jgi:hypothetical protein
LMICQKVQIGKVTEKMTWTLSRAHLCWFCKY